MATNSNIEQGWLRFEKDSNKYRVISYGGNEISYSLSYTAFYGTENRTESVSFSYAGTSNSFNVTQNAYGVIYSKMVSSTPSNSAATSIPTSYTAGFNLETNTFSKKNTIAPFQISYSTTEGILTGVSLTPSAKSYNNSDDLSGWQTANVSADTIGAYSDSTENYGSKQRYYPSLSVSITTTMHSKDGIVTSITPVTYLNSSDTSKFINHSTVQYKTNAVGSFTLKSVTNPLPATTTTNSATFTTNIVSGNIGVNGTWGSDFSNNTPAWNPSLNVTTWSKTSPGNIATTVTVGTHYGNTSRTINATYTPTGESVGNLFVFTQSPAAYFQEFEGLYVNGITTSYASYASGTIFPSGTYFVALFKTNIDPSKGGQYFGFKWSEKDEDITISSGTSGEKSKTLIYNYDKTQHSSAIDLANTDSYVNPAPAKIANVGNWGANTYYYLAVPIELVCGTYATAGNPIKLELSYGKFSGGAWTRGIVTSVSYIPRLNKPAGDVYVNLTPLTVAAGAGSTTATITSNAELWTATIAH